MAEANTQQPSSRGKSRRERVEYARSRDILDVASELNMELVRSGRDYRWKEHDSMVISPDKKICGTGFHDTKAGMLSHLLKR